MPHAPFSLLVSPVLHDLGVGHRGGRGHDLADGGVLRRVGPVEGRGGGEHLVARVVHEGAAVEVGVGQLSRLGGPGGREAGAVALVHAHRGA